MGGWGGCWSRGGSGGGVLVDHFYCVRHGWLRELQFNVILTFTRHTQMHLWKVFMVLLGSRSRTAHRELKPVNQLQFWHSNVSNLWVICDKQTFKTEDWPLVYLKEAKELMLKTILSDCLIKCDLGHLAWCLGRKFTDWSRCRKEKASLKIPSVVTLKKTGEDENKNLGICLRVTRKHCWEWHIKRWISSEMPFPWFRTTLSGVKVEKKCQNSTLSASA